MDVLGADRIDELKALARQKAERGAVAACMFLKGVLKEVVNVQAPRRKVRSANGNYFAATTPATPGAPPRKVSGMGQRSIEVFRVEGGAEVRATKYMAHLEHNGHPWVAPTVEQFADELRLVAGAAMKVELL